MEWDDLRYVLAVHKAGSVAGAGRALNISHVTVFRRLEKIEKALGVRLFDRRSQGYVATAVGMEIVEEAEKLEDQINSLERRVWRKDSEVRGIVRLTTTDTIAFAVLPELTQGLREKHPGLQLEVIISHNLLNISKRDADVAIRHGTTVPEALIGHRLVTVRYAVYCASSLAPPRGRSADLSKMPWVAPDDTPSQVRFAKWLRENGHESRIACRADSFLAMAAAVKAGVGVGLLSCFTAERLGGLTRLTPPIDSLDWGYWVLTHPELRRVARVATVYAYIRESFAALQPLFAGQD
jgi:DNA-binding transcriptional LysR family regulator